MRTLGRMFLCGLLGSLAGLPAGCGSTTDRIELMPPPAVFAEGLVDPFADTGPGSPKFQLLYVTDRAPATGDDEEPFYRNARGHTLRAGEADIEFELSGIAWQTVKRESLSKTRDREYVLRVAATAEFGSLDRTRTLFDKEKHASADARFKKAIHARIAASRRKNVSSSGRNCWTVC